MSSLPHASPVPLLDAGRRVLRALGLLPPETAGMFTGLADDLLGAWPRAATESAEAISPAARRARGSARQVQLLRAFPAWPSFPSFQPATVIREVRP